MDIFRAGDEGVRRVRERDPGVVRDAGMALLRGGGFAVDGYRILPVAHREVPDGFGMLAVDHAGDVVLLEFRTEHATGATVGDALADAAQASGVDYAELNEWYEQLTGGHQSLDAAHAQTFERAEPLDPTAFNTDQRLLLFAPGFGEEMAAAADFLRSKRVGVHPVSFTAYSDGEDHLLAFEPLAPIEPDRSSKAEPMLTRSAGTKPRRPPRGDAAEDVGSRGEDPDIETGAKPAPPTVDLTDRADGPSSPTRDDAVAGVGRTEPTDSESTEVEQVTDPETGGSLDEEEASSGHASTDRTARPGQCPSPDRDRSVTPDRVSDTLTGGSTEDSSVEEVTSNYGEIDASDSATSTASEPNPEPLLEAAYERLQGRLSTHFEGDVDEVLSLETKTDEVLLRPDHPAYAGGVLRYRLRTTGERSAAEFRLDVYGGSDVEKERMRAVLRRYEPDLEEELGFEVDDGYDTAVRTEPLHVTNGRFDESEARAVAEEFERLVGYVHPRVMRAWREAGE